MDVGTRLEVAGTRYSVAGRLGSGGQGDVFEIVDDAGDRRLALKWYHPHTATADRRRHLATLVSRGAPSEHFLWPIGLIDDPSDGRFGYVMDVRPTGFVGVPALLSGRVPRDERAVVRFAFELAVAFRDLHLKGLCYRDVNLGNAFLDPTTGDALICDTDNVGIEGVDRAEVLGTPRFMAPEIVRGEAMPSKLTDRYSLAVMLFYLLVVHHPLEGARTETGIADAEAVAAAYGYRPLFCFDPDDRSNRPVPELHPHVETMWSVLSARTRALFLRSFGEGLDEPHKRVVDSEWCRELADLWASHVACPDCGTSFGWLPAGEPQPSCPAGHPLDIRLSLRTGRLSLPAIEHGELTSHHLSGDLDLRTRYGVVERHPTIDDILGLRICHPSGATYVDTDGQHFLLQPGRRGRLAPGSRFVFQDMREVVVENRWRTSDEPPAEEPG